MLFCPPAFSRPASWCIAIYVRVFAPWAVFQLSKYCSLKVERLEDGRFGVSDMIEKPQPGQYFSNYAILGRVVLPPEIFPILEETSPGAGGEIQLTDAMRVLAQSSGMIGVEFSGERYDMGNKLGMLKAIVQVGLAHPEIGEGFRDYLKSLEL